MVRPWLIAVLLALLLTSAPAGAGFEAALDRRDSVLGEPLTLTLRADAVSDESLEGLALAALQKDFEVYTSSTSRQTHTRHGKAVSSETRTLTLYPLRAGVLRLPALRFMGHRSRPLSVTVRESGPGIPHVQFHAALTPERIMARQAATLTLDIYDDGSLQWAPFRLNPPAGTHLRALAESQHQATLAGTPYTVHRLSWALMPLRAGSATVIFPMLDAVKFGQRLRYAVAPLQFEAIPAPGYLPLHVPIGALTVTSHPPSGKLMLNRPVDWDITIRGNSLSAEGLARLLPALDGGEEVRFYPPQISLVETSRQTLEQTWRVTQPLQPLRAGVLRLPRLALAYYDPDQGQVAAALVPAVTMTVENPLWRKLGGGLAVVSVLAAAGWLLSQAWRILRRLRLHRAALRRILEAQNADELDHALRAFDCGHGIAPGHTLAQWLAALERRHGTNAPLAQVVRQVEAMRYGLAAGKQDWVGLRQAAWRALRTLRIK